MSVSHIYLLLLDCAGRLAGGVHLCVALATQLGWSLPPPRPKDCEGGAVVSNSAPKLISPTRCPYTPTPRWNICSLVHIKVGVLVGGGVRRVGMGGESGGRGRQRRIGPGVGNRKLLSRGVVSETGGRLPDTSDGALAATTTKASVQ